MPLIQEYDYYEATLGITVVTQRPEAAPANLLVAATLHDQYAARVRGLLREWRAPLDPYLTACGYDIRKIEPAGTSREIDRDFQQDILQMQFRLGVALNQSAWTADERVVFAFERNLEKAVADLFAANGVPHVFIPGDDETQGESFIQILVSGVAATNLGAWQVTA